ncbi:Tyrosine recombinase XerC [Acaryochloris thomasi RCC1774]|uniref:Tyrosine recombinase XerC n=1 Tax=Acaryochloris thomasi RCC1774 TaxID=1764569 RepID=A0A2W1JMN7_9CYAN|nr:site-specific integrase [Acaryochloris thomasi]PZD70167.1 Tyrosine recombinase XerC [Acaryochloris thomasi RCC1774]
MSPSFATVATEFIDRPGLSQTTTRSYESTLMPLLQLYGRFPIDIVDRDLLETYLNGLTELRYSTHHRHQAIVQALMNYAVDRNYIRVNPIARLPRRKADPQRGEHQSDQVIRYLTAAQLHSLYQAVAKARRMKALIHLLHRSGARISEVLALDLADIDMNNSRFQVVGKGNKTRWCFFSTDAQQSLEKYLKHYRHPQSPALFTAQHRFSLEISRLNYSTAYKSFKQLIAGRPELEGIRLHDLRHTFATERVGLMGLEELRALMGHQNIQTTLRYQKVTSAQAKHAAQKAFQSLQER